MSETRQHRAVPTQRPAEPQEVTGWVGWILFAAIMMITIGCLHAIEGLTAIFKSGYYTVPASNLVVSIDYTAWGWAHIAIGILVVAAGASLFSGRLWARVTTVVLAAISALVNLVFIAAYPWWSLTVIALDVLVIYAVAVHGHEMQTDY
jgi:hypothetical protein